RRRGRVAGQRHHLALAAERTFLGEDTRHRRGEAQGERVAAQRFTALGIDQDQVTICPRGDAVEQHLISQPHLVASDRVVDETGFRATVYFIGRKADALACRQSLCSESYWG